jgi:hypothetical protein
MVAKRTLKPLADEESGTTPETKMKQIYSTHLPRSRKEREIRRSWLQQANKHLS